MDLSGNKKWIFALCLLHEVLVVNDVLYDTKHHYQRSVRGNVSQIKIRIDEGNHACSFLYSRFSRPPLPAFISFIVSLAGTLECLPCQSYMQNSQTRVKKRIGRVHFPVRRCSKSMPQTAWILLLPIRNCRNPLFTSKVRRETLSRRAIFAPKEVGQKCHLTHLLLSGPVSQAFHSVSTAFSPRNRPL
jgi:hypothetical protein